MENVRIEMESESKTRMQLFREFFDVDCVTGCSGRWLVCTKQTLEQNNYEAAVLTESVKTCGEENREIYL